MVQARRQDETKETKLKSALDELLARNDVLKTGNEEVRHLFEETDISCNQNEWELSELKERVNLDRSSLENLQGIY